MLSLYAAAFAGDGDGNIFKKAENDNNTAYQLELEQQSNLGPGQGVEGGGVLGEDDLPPSPIDGYVLGLAGVALGIIVLYRRKIVLSNNKF